MADFNTVIMSGRLTKDPETRHTASGDAVVSFAIAVNRMGKDAPTDFWDCTAWRKTGEFIANWFTKGKPILIRGAVQKRKYTTKDGQERTIAEINVQEAFFFGGNSEPEATPKAPVAPPADLIPTDDPLDSTLDAALGEDLPF